MRPSRSAALTVEGEQEASRASSARGSWPAVASALMSLARAALRPGLCRKSSSGSAPSGSVYTANRARLA